MKLHANVLATLVIGLGLTLGAGCGKHDEGEHKEKEHPKESAHADERKHEGEVHLSPEALQLAGVAIAPVERRALAGGIAIPAEIQFEPSSTAHIGPISPGRITRVSVALGDRVKKGQLLGVVASGDASAARTRLDQARARLASAQSSLERQQKLSAEGIGAGRALTEAETEVKEQQAEVDGLRRQLSVFGSGSSGELALTSPIAGVVVALHGTLGETATPDEPIFVVTDPTKVWVRGNVPELALSNVAAGSSAVVRLHAYPEVAMTGTVTYVAPALDEKTRSLPIKVSLQAPDARLRSGLYGSIELVGSGADNRVLAVPADAIATLDGQTVVFAVADEPGSFKAVPIALGRRAGAHFEVRNGLTEGAQIAISGAFTLKSALRSGERSEGHAH